MVNIKIEREREIEREIKWECVGEGQQVKI